MSLGDALVDKLKKAARKGEVEVTEGEVRASADITGSGPYGAEVRGVSVGRTSPAEGDRGERMSKAVDAIEDRVRYLSEELEALECDASSARGVLRTKRASVKQREYWELEVDGGDRVDVGRFRGSSAGGRERLAENFGHGTMKRLVDDLAEVVGESEPEE